MAYEARILADSISPAKHRLTTFLVTFPRIVLAEVNTHKMLSKSSASSRAIPVEKRIAAVEADPFVPEAFGRNKAGMQHDEVLEGDADAAARFHWAIAQQGMIAQARVLAGINVHKQLANRLLEPFSWHTAIISGTDWDNFWHLRVHPAAQGEFSKAAAMMLNLYSSSAPRRLEYGEWHLPFVPELDIEAVRREGAQPEWVNWAKVSVARCGRVSFNRHELRDFDKDIARAEEFARNGHMAPLEHAARPMSPWELDAFEQYEALFWVDGEGERTMRVTEKFLDAVHDHSPDFEHIRLVGKPRRVHYCGNYNGFVQLRKLIPNEADALAPKETQP